jgi:hypothetical protein
MTERDIAPHYKGYALRTAYTAKISIRGRIPQDQPIDSFYNIWNQISHPESSCQVRRSLTFGLWIDFPWFGTLHVCTSAMSKINPTSELRVPTG